MRGAVATAGYTEGLRMPPDRAEIPAVYSPPAEDTTSFGFLHFKWQHPAMSCLHHLALYGLLGRLGR